MKITPLKLTRWLGLVALVANAWAQDTVAPATAVNSGPPAVARPAGTLRFNFRGAPLEQVLNYMSAEAGYIIVSEAPIRGTVDAYSAQPVSREEAMQLLNFALNKAGYTSVTQGRIITISSKDDAKKKNLPIRTGNDPDEIPNTAEMYIQIIPLRHLDATTAARDLGTLLPGSASLTANADSNALIVTDTNINLKQVVNLVNALDTSSDSVSTQKKFTLANADPVEMAALLTNLYAAPQTNQANGRGGPNGQFAGGFGGAGGRGGAGGGANGAGGGGRGGGAGAAGRGAGRGGSTARIVPVVVVADPRTFSVIVTAAKEQMPDIESMISQLDVPSARKQQAFVYTMENANVKQVETALKNLFPSSTVRTTTNTQPDPLTSRATTNAQQNTTQNLQLGTATPAARTN